MSVLIVGSIALDSVRTATDARHEVLGGAASYAAVSASFFQPVNLVGIVGSDFPKAYLELFQQKKINLEGLQIADGKTFRWTGEYEVDFNRRQTLHTELNVFETFNPQLPAAYRDAPVVLLGNIHPGLQHTVLDQIDNPKFVAADTMDLWINTTHEELLSLLPRVNLLVLNDGEARQLTAQDNLIKAGQKILTHGPDYVAIKKGEHGCLLLSRSGFFTCGAYPVENVVDPTGAGDTFAGALAGFLGSVSADGITFDEVRRAIVHGTILASFCVEAFSLDRLKDLTAEEVEDRYRFFRAMSRFD